MDQVKRQIKLLSKIHSKNILWSEKKYRECQAIENLTKNLNMKWKGSKLKQKSNIWVFKSSSTVKRIKLPRIGKLLRILLKNIYQKESSVNMSFHKDLQNLSIFKHWIAFIGLIHVIMVIGCVFVLRIIKIIILNWNCYVVIFSYSFLYH